MKFMKENALRKIVSLALVVAVVTMLAVPIVSAVEARSSRAIDTTISSGGSKNYTVTKSAGTTLSVSFSNSTSNTSDPCAISITCTDSAGGIETKSMYSGTRQFFDKPAGTTYINLYNDGFYSAYLSGSIHYV